MGKLTELNTCISLDHGLEAINLLKLNDNKEDVLILASSRYISTLLQTINVLHVDDVSLSSIQLIRSLGYQ